MQSFVRPALRRAFVISTVSVLVLMTARASAHEPPEIGQILWSRSSDAIVLRTNRGLIFGDASAQNWRYMCSAAWGTPFGEQPDLAYLPDGRLLAATTQGLELSADEGCTWSGMTPFGSVRATSLAHHPLDPNRLYLGVWDGDRSGLYATPDAGATWKQLLRIGTKDHLAQLLLAPSDPQRIYASGIAFDDRTRMFSFQITRSSDAGKSWQRSYIPLEWGEDEAVLLAISPVDPKVLLLLATSRKRGEEPDRVVISRDEGATFQTLLRAVNLLSGAFSANGDTVFIVGHDALYRSNAALTEAEPSGEAQFVSYVAPHEGRLFVCGNPSGFDPINAGVGVSADGGATFTKLMAFTDVTQTVACAADSNTARACTALWTDWQVEVLVGVGGAPLESVPDWQSLDLAEPEPVTGRPTLSNPTPQAAPGSLVTAPGSAGTAAPMPATMQPPASGGCTVLTRLADAAPSGAFGVSCAVAVLLWRKRGGRTSRK